MKVLFEKLISSPKTSFWKELTKKKLNTYKLDSSLVSISGTIQESKLILDKSSFNCQGILKGYAKIVNTLENFKKIDKKQLISDIGNKNLIPPTFNTFIILIYADLKYNKFIYWVGYPILKSESFFTSNTIQQKPSFFLKTKFNKLFTIIDMNTLKELSPKKEHFLIKNIIIVVLNLTTNLNNPTWLLRNLLYYLQNLIYQNI